MEVLGIIALFGGLGFWIYQTLPSTKLKKANSHIKAGNYNTAISILESIFLKHPDAPSRLANCHLNMGLNIISSDENAAIKSFNNVLGLQAHIPKNANLNAYNLIKEKTEYEICKINFNKCTIKEPLIEKEASLKENLAYLSKIQKFNLGAEFQKLEKQHFDEISQINYSFGLQNEKGGKVVEAKNKYSIAIKYSKDNPDNPIAIQATARLAICKVKLGDIIESDDLQAIQNAPDNFKNDFHYRRSCELIRKKHYEQAKEYIQSNINSNASAVKQLYNIINTERQKFAISCIDDINKNLEELFDNSFPSENVKQLYEKIEKVIKEVKSILPDIAVKLENLRPSLFNRLLSHYISENEFDNAINLIQKFPLYWENPELLKNLGICCYGYTHQGKLSEKNYKTIVSSWLTAVFCDKVILNSLEYTKWDDTYTFSLKDSIGSNYDIYENLPKNVNLNEVTNTNISIGNTQRELINQFETLLHRNIENNEFIRTIQEFHSSEKDSIEKLVSILKYEVPTATPYFAKLNGLDERIIEEVNSHYVETQNENYLEAGLSYVKSNERNNVGKYAKAKEMNNQLLDAIKQQNISLIKKLNTESNIKLLKKFNSISSKVQDSIHNSISKLIEENDNNESLIDIMNEVISISPNKDKLKFQYSNYVNNYCIRNLEDGNINNFDVLSMLKSAYHNSPANPTICKNIVAFIMINLWDVLNNKTNQQTSIYRVLDELILHQTKTFKNYSVELTEMREGLIRELKKAGTDMSLLIDDPSQPPICYISANYGKTLTPEGEKMKKVLYYLNKFGDNKSSVNRDSLMKTLRKQFGYDDSSPF
jgi:hypothetical protein